MVCAGAALPRRLPADDTCQLDVALAEIALDAGRGRSIQSTTGTWMSDVNVVSRGLSSFGQRQPVSPAVGRRRPSKRPSRAMRRQDGARHFDVSPYRDTTKASGLLPPAPQDSSALALA